MRERSDELGDSGETGDSESDDRGQILGTTTVSRGKRITLIADVRDVFADSGSEVEEGETIVFWLRDGQVVLERA